MSRLNPRRGGLFFALWRGRQAPRISQEDAGKVIGWSQSQVSAWERGVATIPYQEALSLSKYYGIDLRRLLEPEQAHLARRVARELDG